MEKVDQSNSDGGPRELLASWWALGSCALLLLLCVWPALYNGYPLVFHDSTQYLWFAFDPLGAKVIHAHYNAYYPWLVAPSFFFRSTWVVVILQAVITLLVLLAVYRKFLVSASGGLLVVLIALTLFLNSGPLACRLGNAGYFCRVGFPGFVVLGV